MFGFHLLFDQVQPAYQFLLKTMFEINFFWSFNLDYILDICFTLISMSIISRLCFGVMVVFGFIWLIWRLSNFIWYATEKFSSEKYWVIILLTNYLFSCLSSIFEFFDCSFFQRLRGLSFFWFCWIHWIQ